MDDFLPAILQLELAAAQFLQRSAFAFQFFLGALEFGEFLLGFHHLAVHVFTRRRAQGVGGGQRRFMGLKVRINKFRRVVFGCHKATVTLF